MIHSHSAPLMSLPEQSGLMSERTATSMGCISPASRFTASAPEAAHHVGSPAGLTAKALAKQFGDIGFVIDDQDAHAHAAAPAVMPSECGAIEP
jgi:hypothetical protein